MAYTEIWYQILKTSLDELAYDMLWYAYDMLDNGLKLHSKFF